MSNLADLIEEYILTRLAEKQADSVELRRNDIAGAISCAPSQISYVLNTRFTEAKGFSVESRRGLGGYIRIVKVPVEANLFTEILDTLTIDTTLDDYQNIIKYLIARNIISAKEGAIAFNSVSVIYNQLPRETLLKLMKSQLLTMQDFS